MFFFSPKAQNILGMNARNLEYISRYNSAEHKKFTTHKLFTKRFLESRGIQVAKTYHAINNHRQLTSEFFESLPASFVIKPNKGWGGGGIIVITEKKDKHWITGSGKKLTSEYLFQHCVSILDGKYSLSGVTDIVIFEEVLEKHSSLRNFTDIGLPDIRVIVFNKVPVMAMMRIPTHESEGKANMELGAIGVGIDMGTGITTRGAHYSSSRTKMPNGFSIKGFKIPFWEEILLIASQIQHFTGIGYLGVDFVLTKTGVKVLELNSLSGLKIQIANKIPLKERLEKIKGLKVKTPEEGVEIAKTLFTQTKTNHPGETPPTKTIIGTIENVLLNNEKPVYVRAHISTTQEENILCEKYYTGPMLDITLGGKRLKLPVEKGSEEAELTLSAKFLTDFYIDPTKKTPQKVATFTVSNIDEKMINNVDEKVCEIDGKIKLLSYINPQNLAEQKKLFLENPEFSPRFFYRKIDLDLEHLRRDLKKIPSVNHPLFPLFEKKIENIEYKLDLLESVGSDSFQEASERIFGAIKPPTYRSALKFLEKGLKNFTPDESEIIEMKDAVMIIEEFLKHHRISHWKISIINDSAVDIQVTKKHTILMRKGTSFRRNRLEALLVHEIGTHVFRFENGRMQPFRIFERGTAEYLRTEEGLAIWNQNHLQKNLGEKFLTPAFQIIAIYLGQKMSFLDLFHYLKNTYEELSDELLWKLCLKAKRGLTDTKKKQVFTKDSLYFRGNQDIERFIKNDGKVEDLYIGKISIKDLDILKSTPDLKPPKFLWKPSA